MPRKKRTPPKFKVGDWVLMKPHTESKYAAKWLRGRPLRVRAMEYEARWEKQPSPWSCAFEQSPVGFEDYCVFEEDLEYDVFLTAVSDSLAKEKE